MPYSETFDASSGIPAGWSLSGFELSSSVPRSSPHCILARGNMAIQSVSTDELDPIPTDTTYSRTLNREDRFSADYRWRFTAAPDPDLDLAFITGFEYETEGFDQKSGLNSSNKDFQPNSH